MTHKQIHHWHTITAEDWSVNFPVAGLTTRLQKLTGNSAS